MNLTARINTLRDFLSKHNIDSMFISDNTAIGYYSGFFSLYPKERESYLLITKQHAYIAASPLYEKEIASIGQTFQLLQLSSAANKTLTQQIADIIKKESITTIGYQPYDLRVLEFNNLTKKLSHVTWQPCDISELRSIKDIEEIRAVEKACTIGDQTFDYILTQIKEGMTENEIKFLLETYIRKHKAEPSFISIIAFGANAAVPHHTTNNTKLKKGQCILLDFGVLQDNYCSDMTRTIFLGEPTDEEKRVYETVKIAQEKSYEYVQKTKKPTAHLIDQQARDYIIAQGFSDFPHASHGIGLEVHEMPHLWPASTDTITPGMVFTIEPGIYLSGHMGVRIEDTIVFESSEPRILTKSSKELIIL